LDENEKKIRKLKTLPRRPTLCPGCPHRGSFHVIKKEAEIITGDIGCYGLAALPPLSAMDTIVCMGASVSMAEGFSKILSILIEQKLTATGIVLDFHKIPILI